MTDREHIRLHRYDRQRLFHGIGPSGQASLTEARVCLMGCGALGTHVADSLARAGIGFLRIVDRDLPEITNLQRQILFDEADIGSGVPKAIAATEKLRKVNSMIQIEPIVADINSGNIEGFTEDVDIIVDGSDNFELRYLINDVAIKQNKPWVYGGVISSYGMSMTIRPGETPCLQCIFPEAPAPGDTPTCDTAGVIAPAVSVVAGIEAAEVLKLATGRIDQLNDGLISIDVWDFAFRTMSVPDKREDCPACGKHEFRYLDLSAPRQTTDLCGADAIQVMINPAPKIDLKSLGQRLEAAGTVDVNPFLLRFQTEDHHITVFPDGRAIIKGTTDPTEARSIYARFIGM